MALSGDGSVLAVGALHEGSGAVGVNADPRAASASDSGAAYLFGGGNPLVHAYLKPSNTRAGDELGASVALSADGSTVAVGAIGEPSKATGVDGNQTDTSARDAGAVYVFH